MVWVLGVAPISDDDDGRRRRGSTMETERTKLIRAGASGERPGAHSWFFASGRPRSAAIAVATGSLLAVLSLVSSRASTASSGVPAGRQTRYVLRTRCVPDEVKAANANFFASDKTIVKAKLVKHNYGSPDFFEYDDGIEMEPVTYEDTGWEWDWESGRFYVDTDALDYEWGFALENSDGEILYEIGGDGNTPLLRKKCRDLVNFASPEKNHFNRLITKETGNGNKIEYVFGSCNNTCPERPFVEWPEEQRDEETQRVLADTPNELGSEFSMYGTAGTGVCQFDIFVEGDNGNPNDAYSRNRLLHFLPADYRSDVHTNSKKAPAGWTGEVYWRDSNNNKYWPTQFGPRGDTTSTHKWRVRMVLKETFVEISACDDWTDDSHCEVKSQDPYFSGQTYEDITGVGMTPGYSENLIPGSCDFYAVRGGPKKNLNF